MVGGGRGLWGVGHQAGQWVSYASVEERPAGRERRDPVEPMVLSLPVAKGDVGGVTGGMSGGQRPRTPGPRKAGSPLSRAAILLGLC